MITMSKRTYFICISLELGEPYLKHPTTSDYVTRDQDIICHVDSELQDKIKYTWQLVNGPSEMEDIKKESFKFGTKLPNGNYTMKCTAILRYGNKSQTVTSEFWFSLICRFFPILF